MKYVYFVSFEVVIFCDELAVMAKPIRSEEIVWDKPIKSKDDIHDIEKALHSNIKEATKGVLVEGKIKVIAFSLLRVEGEKRNKRR